MDFSYYFVKMMSFNSRVNAEKFLFINTLIELRCYLGIRVSDLQFSFVSMRSASSKFFAPSFYL